jgi:hypothetical protein
MSSAKFTLLRGCLKKAIKQNWDQRIEPTILYPSSELLKMKRGLNSLPALIHSQTAMGLLAQFFSHRPSLQLSYFAV